MLMGDENPAGLSELENETPQPADNDEPEAIPEAMPETIDVPEVGTALRPVRCFLFVGTYHA